MSRNLHPTFQSKTVVKLLCKCCERCLCARGMKAILLADTKVELYSTDLPPEHSIQLIGNDYRTKSCCCRIKDVACLGWELSLPLTRYILRNLEVEGIRRRDCPGETSEEVIPGDGCVVGYHVILPCATCLSSCNNGHFWMFHSDVTYPVDRLDATGTEIMVWGSLPSCTEDTEMRDDDFEIECFR